MSKAPRADFALGGGKFPLNTPGRVAAAPGLAAYSERKGNMRVTAIKGDEVFYANGNIGDLVGNMTRVVRPVLDRIPHARK